MQHERNNFPKRQIHEKTLSTSEVIYRSEKSCGVPKRDQSLFSLLLEIESRLRKDSRNDQNEQRKRCKERDRWPSKVNNLSRYRE
jgi:hypothetical protein